MNSTFEILRITRENILKAVQGLSDEQLLKVPEGFNNNILWNMGHVVSSNQRLIYFNSGVPMRIPDHYPIMFAKGTDPRQWTTKPDVKEVKEYLISTVSMLEQDIDKGIFMEYKEYQTSYGFLIRNLADAISFGNTHEALHLGVIMAMKKLV